MKEKYKKLILFCFSVVSLFLSVSFFVWTIFPNIQIMYFYTNLSGVLNGESKEMTNSNITFSPYTWVQPEIRGQFLSYIFDAQLEHSIDPQIVQFAVNKMEESVLIEHNYSTHFLNLGIAYDLLADLNPAKKDEMLLKAEENYKKGLDVLPGNQRIYYAYAINLANQGKSKEAILIAKKALDEDSNVAESHYYYGIMLYKEGGGTNLREALKEMEFAFNSGYKTKDDLSKKIYEKFLVYFYNQNDIDNIKIVLNRLVIFDKVQSPTYEKIIDYINKTGNIPLLNIN